MRKDAPLSPMRVALTYGITSALLASAWYAKVPFGLWIANAVAGSVGIGLGLVALGVQRRSIWGFSLANAARGVALGLLMVGLTQFLGRMLLPRMPIVLTEAERLYAILQTEQGNERFMPVIALVVVAEELVFRGAVTSLCADRLSPGAAVVVSTLLYTVPLAASGSWLLVCIGFALGMAWTFVRLWSGSLAVSLVAHVMWSCSTFVVFPLISP